MDHFVPLTRRQELVETKGVTLDGRPAVIGGSRLDFPVVLTLDGAQRVEFAWPTVDHIVTNRDGAFRS